MRQLCIFLTIFLLSFTAFSQIKVGDNVDTISPASLLELESTDQGILLPRLTTAQRDAQGSWTEGHVIYNTTDSCFQFFDGNIWDCMVGASAQPSAPTTSFPFNILATSANCRISDYITEGAPDTLIKEDKTETLTSVSLREYWYQFQTLAAAMNNHNIIGLQTDDRLPVDVFQTSRADIYYALPDANRYIGKTFLLYTIPDSFCPDPSLSLPAGLSYTFNGTTFAAPPVADRPEDWENDYMTTSSPHNVSPGISSNRFLLYSLGGFPSQVWGANSQYKVGPTTADYSTFDAHFVIITSMGPDDWRVNCTGLFTYENPLAP